MDFIQSIKAHLYDKTTSPLFGAFLVSWIAFNYEFMFILNSTMPVHDRFEYISTFLYCDYTDYLLKGFLFPLGSSIIILLAYPYPARKIYGYWKAEHIKQNNLRLNLEGKALISKKKESEIRKEIADMEIKYENEINKKDSKIKALTNLINDLYGKENESAKTIRSLKEQLSNKEPNETHKNKLGIPVPNDKDIKGIHGLDSNQIKVLLLISKHEGERIGYILDNSSTHKQVTKYNLEQLKERRLISIEDGIKYSLTPEGRKLLVESGYFE